MWGVIITVVIITFVFWGAQSGRDGGGGDAYYGTINGERVTREALGNAQREAILRFFFNYGEWPDRNAKRMGFDIERATYERLLLIQKIEQMGIHVGDDTVTRVAADAVRSFFRDKPGTMDTFVKQVLRQAGLEAGDFERFIRHDLGQQQLLAVVGLVGRLVPPQEGRQLYEREHEELAVEAVFFSGSNHLAGITPTPQAVEEFYTNQMARYRLPERVQVSFVKFDGTNFLAEATNELAGITNVAERIEAVYQMRRTNEYRELKPEEAKSKIHEEFIKGLSVEAARRKANAFATVLMETEPVRPENLEKLAGDKGLTVQVSEPFDREEGPKDLKVGADFVREAFARTAEEPFAGPFTGDDGAYVIALKRKVPSEIPPLDQIRERVTADYRYHQAVTEARKAGAAAHGAVTNGLAQGKTFAAACAEAKVTPVFVPPFSLSTRELKVVEAHVSLVQFKPVAFNLTPGQVSGFVPTGDGGFIIFVREKLPLELTRLTAELPEFLNLVRQTRQNEAVQAWFQREAERGLRETPVFQQKQQVTGTPAKK